MIRTFRQSPHLRLAAFTTTAALALVQMEACSPPASDDKTEEEDDGTIRPGDPVDVDGDGIIDGVALDTDGDGIVDAYDADGDGIADGPFNPNGTGVIDVTPMGGGGPVIDLDGDGVPDDPAENCGDGVLNDDEACDDGNTNDGDGCFGHCLAPEPGFLCLQPGQPCVPFAKCGDGVVSFPESCDDGGLETGDGCNDNCKEEIGYRCDGSPSVCETTTCGDGLKEGAEACEHHPSTLVNGQPMPFGGCTVDTCQNEPDCSGFACESPCGDGLKIGEDEECDDGNTLDGDGCSSTCEIEEGYECTNAPCEIYDPDGDGEGECILRVPVIYRDFNLSFADMKNQGDNSCEETPGLVADMLTNGKPTRATTATNCLSSDANFAKWYTDAAPDNSTIVSELILFDNGSGGFVNRYGTAGDGLSPAQYNGIDGNPSFFPLDGNPLALTDTRHGAGIPEQVYGGNWSASGSHNFHFTSEVQYWFTYEDDMDATLTFIGDDDVWVFINNKLAVDLGGLHVPLQGSVTINGSDITSTSDVASPGAWTATEFGLQDGNVYEIKVFQAERKVVGSSFQLTLAGFEASRSDCRAKCGDGIIGAGEECDDGVNDGGYNECHPGCVLGGYCGDGIVQEGEVCDDGDPDKPAECSGCRILVVR